MPPGVLLPSIWMSFLDSTSRMGGSVVWEENAMPRFVEFLSGWPIIGVQFTTIKRISSLCTTIQRRKLSWHAHVPRRRLGVPDGFRLDHKAIRGCIRQVADSYIFDFAGMAPLPSDEIERRFVVLLEELEEVRRFHPEVLDRLGIEVRVIFRDDPDSLPTT
jgi:hypothetical protein